MTTQTLPVAVHVGRDDLPFVDIGEGNLLKVIRVDEAEALWIVENVFQAGFAVQTHRHTGPVFGYTTAGAWKYREYDDVNRAGSFLYEPAGSVHTLEVRRGRHARVVPHVRREPQPPRGRHDRVGHRRARHAGRLLRPVRGAGARPAERPRQLTAAMTTDVATPDPSDPDPSDPDLSDPDLYVDGPPHELFARLRRDDPVHWQPTPRPGDREAGYWAVLRHADVEEVARAPLLFSSERGGVVLEDLPPDRLEQMRGMLLAMDPPRHREVRRPVVARLTPRAIAALEADITTICHDVLAVDGAVDFVTTIAAKLPTRVIGQVMGLPAADWDHLHTLAERITRGQDPAFTDSAETAGEASREMGVYAYQFAVDRQALDDPPDDLTTVLLASHDPAAFASLFVQLVTAGQDTTATLLAAGLLALLEHPDQLRLLRDDPPSVLPTAVEEMLRFANPLHYFRRTTTADTTLRGVPIKAGDKVATYYTSANRDEEVFTDPHRFDVRRSPNRHLSFGVGEHFCVGAHLARLEARIFFAELLSTYPVIELAGEPVRLRSNLNNALRSLPVHLDR